MVSIGIAGRKRNIPSGIGRIARRGATKAVLAAPGFEADGPGTASRPGAAVGPRVSRPGSPPGAGRTLVVGRNAPNLRRWTSGRLASPVWEDACADRERRDDASDGRVLL